MMPSPLGASGTAEPARKHQINHAYFPHLYENILTCHTALLSDCILFSLSPLGGESRQILLLFLRSLFPSMVDAKKPLSLFLLLLLFGKRAFPGLNGGWRERERAAAAKR